MNKIWITNKRTVSLGILTLSAFQFMDWMLHFLPNCWLTLAEALKDLWSHPLYKLKFLFLQLILSLTLPKRVWIHPWSRCIQRKDFMWRTMAATMPGTAATVSRKIMRLKKIEEKNIIKLIKYFGHIRGEISRRLRHFFHRDQLRLMDTI